MIIKAAAFARKSHEGQVRNYSGTPYILHPARVAGRVAIHPLATEFLVVAAFLHDVVEDTPITLEEIKEQFGIEVAQLVGELTNPSKGMEFRYGTSREERKRIDREHLTTVSNEAKIIKLIDRIDNLMELKGAPNNFVTKYCQESTLLAEVIGDADPELKAELLSVIERLKND